MRRSVAWLIATAATLVGIGHAQQPPPPPLAEPGVYHGIRQSLKIHEPPPLDEEQLRAARLDAVLETAERQVNSPGGVVSLLRTEGVEAGFGGAVKLKIPGVREVAKVGIEANNSGEAKLYAGAFDLVQVGLALNGDERTIGLTVELPTRFSAVKQLAKIEFHYATNRGYIEALGGDVHNVYGMGMALDATQRVLGNVKRDEATGTIPAAPLQAAMTELRKQFSVPMAEAIAKFDSVVTGWGTKVSKKTPNAAVSGEVSVEAMELHRESRTGAKEGEHFHEQKVSFEAAGEAKVRGVHLEGKASVGFKMSDEKKEAPSNHAQLVQAAKIERGEATPASLADLGQAKLERLARAPEVIAAMGRVAKLPHDDARGAERIVATEDPKVGGVMLRFDDELIDRSLSPDEAADALLELDRQLTEGQKSFIVNPEAARDVRLSTVSLRTLLDAQRPTLAPLTRVRGFTISNDDVVLAGDEEPGRPPIDTDVLAALVRTIWKQGKFPYVSLDMSPDDPTGPQKVRIGNLDPDLRASEVARVMLDADYAMKKLMLGADRLPLEGFVSSYDLLVKRPSTGAAETNRFWLYPVQSLAADILEEDGRIAVLFTSNVQVLTERMKRVGDFFVGAGEASDVEAEASRSFTTHYRAIADARPIFAELAGVFDAAKLAAMLHARGVQHTLLDRLASRPVRTVPVRASYAGVGPVRVEGTMLELTGGASARMRTSKHAFLTNAALAPLLRATGDVPVVLKLAPSTPMAATGAKQVDGELLVNKAASELGEHRYDRAEALLTRAIEDDPELGSARIYRALARFGLGNLDGAREDVDRAPIEEPAVRALRGVLRAYLGDRDAAIRDAEEAERADPDDEGVLFMSANARAFAFDLPGAERILGKMLRNAPLDPDPQSAEGFVDLLYKLGPTRAKARLEAIRKVPIPLFDALMSGASLLRRMQFESAEAELKRCIAAAKKADANPSVTDYFMRERCTLTLALAFGMHSKMLAQVDAKAAAGYRKESRRWADELVRFHPDWPSAYLVGEPEPDEHGPSAFDRALAHRDVDDPLVEDIGVWLGTSRTLPWFGFVEWYKIKDKNSPQAYATIRKFLPLLGPGAARDAWAALAAIEGKSAYEAKLVLRRAEKALPMRLEPDPITLSSVGNFYKTLLEREAAGQTLDELEAETYRFLEKTGSVSGLGWEVISQIAAYRFTACMILSQSFEQRFREDERVSGERPRAASGPSPAVLRKVREELVARARRSSKLAAGFVDFSLRLVEQRLSGAQDDDRVAREQARWEVLVDGAESAIDLRTVGILVDSMWAALPIAAEKDPKGTAEMREILAPAHRRLNATRAPTFTPHDWPSWRDPAIASATVGEMQPTLPLMGIGALLVTLAGAFAAEWVRGRVAGGATVRRIAPQALSALAGAGLLAAGFALHPAQTDDVARKRAPAKASAASAPRVAACKEADVAECFSRCERREMSSCESIERACDEGGTEACVRLAAAYQRGIGFEKDSAKAREILQAACEAGAKPANAKACSSLGSIYAQGDQVPPDAEKGIALLRRACDMNQRDACMTLATMYHAGNGVPRDDAQALAFLERPCQANDVEVCGNLARLLEAGNEWIAKDEAKARSYLSKACAGGHAPSCNRLRELGVAPAASESR